MPLYPLAKTLILKAKSIRHLSGISGFPTPTKQLKSKIFSTSWLPPSQKSFFILNSELDCFPSPLSCFLKTRLPDKGATPLCLLRFPSWNTSASPHSPPNILRIVSRLLSTSCLVISSHLGQLIAWLSALILCPECTTLSITTPVPILSLSVAYSFFWDSAGRWSCLLLSASLPPLKHPVPRIYWLFMAVTRCITLYFI